MITTFENRCVLKTCLIILIPIFNTTYNGENRSNIYMSSISRIGPIPIKLDFCTVVHGFIIVIHTTTY